MILKIKSYFKNKVYLLIGFFTLCTSVYGQDQKVADSLVFVFNKTEMKGEQLFELLREISYNQQNPEDILFYSKLLIAKASLDSAHIWIHRGYFDQGSGYRLAGDFDNAINSYFKSIEAAKKIDNQSGIGAALLSIGDVYANNEDYKNSIAYQDQAIVMLRNANDSLNLAGALMNTGYNYYLINQYDSALSYYKESGIIYEIKDFKLGKAYNIGNSGLVYAKQGKNEIAERDIIQAIEILETYDDSYAITEFQIAMAEIYSINKNFNLAIKYSNDALRIAENDNLKERIRDASLKLSKLYQSTENYEKAYKYQTQYIAFRDSINNIETTRKIADLKTEFEVGQKQAELDAAELQNAAERKQSIIIGAALVAVLILIGIIAFIQYKSSKQKQKTNKILAIQKEELQELNHTKDRFFSIISHDLRGPVNAFAGISKLIKMYIKRGKVEEINEMAGDIDESAGRLSSLLDNLLEWAVQQQGQFPYAPEKVSFHKITNELINTFETTATGKEINLYSKIANDIHLFVDQNSTTTIFRNLVGNALKFTPDGGEVYFEAEVEDDNALLKVTDTGVGIPKEKFDKLFSLSENKSTWGTSGEKGLGLGLQLAFEFTEMNQGQITVKSEEGVGTTFIVKLPLFESEKALV